MKLNTNFTEREILVLASILAQVNNWTQFILAGEADQTPLIHILPKAVDGYWLINLVTIPISIKQFAFWELL